MGGTPTPDITVNVNNNPDTTTDGENTTNGTPVNESGNVEQGAVEDVGGESAAEEPGAERADEPDEGAADSAE